MVFTDPQAQPPLPDFAARAAEAQAFVHAGDLDRAAAVCQGMLAALPDQPNALIILGVVRMKQQRWAEAEELLKKGCHLYPKSIGFFINLGRLYVLCKRYGEALVPLQTAVLLEPGNHHHRASLLGMYQVRIFKTFDPAAKQAMILCLQDKRLSHNFMSAAWLSLLCLDPALAPVLRLLECRDYESFRAAATPDILRIMQQDEFLTGGLRRILVPDMSFERGLTFLRRLFFENPDLRRDFFPLLCVLAQYCFFTEYAFIVSEDVGDLRAHHDTAEEAALLGCYEPLHRYPEVAALSDHPEFRELVRLQIEEPLEERRIAGTIPALSPIVDDVSAAVRAQYEENPYPRWNSVGNASMPADVRELARGKKILVAGTGTGREIAEIALLFPLADVTGIDLSRASLSYGIRKCREQGIGNIRFLHGDLLDVEKLGEQFDLVVSSGVLHHMKDPVAGWRTLLGVVKPGGYMKIALYSTIARSLIKDARDYVKAQDWPATPDGIRAFRADVMGRAASDPLRKSLATSNDFYSISQCRDLVFHVQEHTYTMPELKRIMGSLDLTMTRMDVRQPEHMRIYRARFPDDPDGSNPDNWHVIEQENPAIFAGMYSMWMHRANEKDIADFGWIKATSRV